MVISSARQNKNQGLTNTVRLAPNALAGTVLRGEFSGSYYGPKGREYMLNATGVRNIYRLSALVGSSLRRREYAGYLEVALHDDGRGPGFCLWGHNNTHRMPETLIDALIAADRVRSYANEDFITWPSA